jgi:drug/metabolite transporter (DMT)-like permease
MLQQVGTTFMAQVSYLIPPFGLFWGWLFLDQVPASTTWIALLLILAGLAVTSTKYARRSA